MPCFPYFIPNTYVIVGGGGVSVGGWNERYIFHSISKLTCKQGALRPYSLNHIQLVQDQLF